jgi:signal transduction histidine kinase
MIFMGELTSDFQKDINDIAQIPIISGLLDVVCQTTGMGFAAVARVTEDRWITCGVRDDIGFGLKPGDELELKTTICNEIRLANEAVVIDHVKEDPDYHDHHTPALYGFQSYISVPIVRKDGTFFGTLCAIDPHPNNLKTSAVTEMFKLFSDLIAFHLHTIDSLRDSESRLLKDKEFIDVLELKVQQRTMELEENNASLEKMNKELQSFAYISSHDLQEPLRKIQSLASFITEKESANLSPKGLDYFNRMRNAAARMQSLINDLLSYSRTNMAERIFKFTDLAETVKQVESDLSEELAQKEAILINGIMCHVNIIPFQFRQLLQNLISNSIKFASPDRQLQISITSSSAPGSSFSNALLNPAETYCHVQIKDNGIGFEPQYGDKIFQLFQRLHDRSHYSGTGIGLAIVKKIIENHNGFITASGEPDNGAVFDIYLPQNNQA